MCILICSALLSLKCFVCICLVPVCLSVCLSIYLLSSLSPVYLSYCQSCLSMSLCLSICLCLCMCLYTHLFVCLVVWLCVSVYHQPLVSVIEFCPCYDNDSLKGSVNQISLSIQFTFRIYFIGHLLFFFTAQLWWPELTNSDSEVVSDKQKHI